MPDKIYDYTAAGLPVVNSLLGEVSGIIRKNGIGLQYKAGDADDLLRALSFLENCPNTRLDMAARSRLIGGEYDKVVQYGKFVDLVHRVVAVRTSGKAA